MRAGEQQLLADVLDLGPTAPQDFLSETLRLVRRKRRMRQVCQSAGLTAVLLAAALLCWPRPEPTAPTLTNKPSVLRVVTTRPMKPSAFIRTDPRSVQWITSSEASVAVFSTPPMRIEELTDEQLLARMGKAPVILVRHTTNEAELIVP
jgi:DNA-binding phage protein